MIGDRVRGIIRLINNNVEGNGGAQSLTIAPEAEEVWVLLWARATHTDDGGNRKLEWFLDDQVIATPTLIRDASTIAANVGVDLLADNVVGPLVLEHFGLNVIIQGTGVLAGHYLGYAALVEVYSSPIGKNRMLQASA